jgi:hypothetical protein
MSQAALHVATCAQGDCDLPALRNTSDLSWVRHRRSVRQPSYLSPAARLCPSEQLGIRMISLHRSCPLRVPAVEVNLDDLR